jgi:hypothetical protein
MNMAKRGRKPSLDPKDMIVSVCFPGSGKRFVDIANSVLGTTTSQFFCQAGIEKLVNMQLMPNPLDKYQSEPKA